MISTGNSQAIVAVDTGPTDYVRDIMRQIIAPKIRSNYILNNVKFLLWIYDDDRLREDILKDWFYETNHECKLEDDSNDGTAKYRRQQRKYCKRVLYDMVDELNCPIILNKLTFSIFSHYVTTRKNPDGSLMSKASYGGFRSAMMDIFRATKYEISEEFKKDLKVFMGGMKREVVRQHVQRGKVLDEGKKPMSYEIYRHLCHALSKSGDVEDMFCHLFLVLEWNLMARSEIFLQMSLTHVQWRNDSLTCCHYE